MRLLRRTVVPAGVVCLLLAANPRVGADQSAPQGEPATPQPSVNGPLPELFAGFWDYNAAESVNAATKRPEQSPRSATTPGGGAARAGGGSIIRLPNPSMGGSSTSDGWGEGVSRSASAGRGGPSPLLLRENRDLSRDLLEIPEALTIKVASDNITFIDDLSRERTYPTDGTRKKYQLAASRFNAKMVWDGSQLHKDIEGGFGFKMTETYFLSADGQRLFVILRVVQTRRDGPIVGANRVYDRVAVE